MNASAKRDEHDRPYRHDACEPDALDRRLRSQHDPQAEKQPERIAPHGDERAAAGERQRQQRDDRSERQQRDDPPVIGVRPSAPARGRGHNSGAAIARAGSRNTSWSAAKSSGWATYSNRSRAWRGARIRIAERKKIVLHQPEQMRSGDRQCDRAPPHKAPASARLCRARAIDEKEQRKRHREHDDEIFRPQRKAEAGAEHAPMHAGGRCATRDGTNIRRPPTTAAGSRRD